MLHKGLPRKHHDHRQRDYSLEGTRGGSFLRSALKTVPLQSEWTIGGFYAIRLKTYLSGEYSGGDRKSGTLPPSERTQSCGKHLLGHFEGSPWAPTSLDFAVAGANRSVRERNERGDGSGSSVPDQGRLRARLLCRDHFREKCACPSSPRWARQRLRRLLRTPGSNGALR